MSRFPRIVPTGLRKVACAGALTLAVGVSAGSLGDAGATAKHHTVVLVSTKHSATLGQYLVTTSGFTLYTFTLDTPTKSACTGICATAWPPVLVPKGAKLSSLVRGVKASKLGKVNRGHGKFQLSYEGKPLYRFAGDKAPGQTTGQGFENMWTVALVSAKVAPAATPVTATVPPTTAAVSHASSNTNSSPTSPAPTSPPPTSPPPTTPPTTAPPPTTTVPPVSGGGGGYGY
jgi:predicted lipoprotein with Yx(FWY)xxD motif